jgi:hypothetical protein
MMTGLRLNYLPGNFTETAVISNPALNNSLTSSGVEYVKFSMCGSFCLIMGVANIRENSVVHDLRYTKMLVEFAFCHCRAIKHFSFLSCLMGNLYLP